MPFQINTSKLFLTYPQCDVPKEDVLEILRLALPEFSSYIVAHELHQNGDDHIHCYIEFPEPFRSRNSKFADLHWQMRDYHGNYQGCRSAKNVIKYCTKAEDFISNMDVAALLQKKNSKREMGAKIVLEESNLTDLVLSFPELIFGYKKLKADIEQYRYDAQDKRISLPNWLPNPWGKVLPVHISDKRRHYWIFSRAPNKGKTYHFAKPLFDEYLCGLQCGDFSYWQLGGREECIILDEYNTSLLKYSQLNSMADGGFNYRIFQGGCIRLKDPLIIILSNQSINDMYPNMNVLLHARFREIEIV